MPDLKDLKNAQYVLLPASLPFSNEMTELYNRVFDFWLTRWSSAFAETGAPEGYWPDHYQRQSLIAAIVTPDEVIGCHLYTFYNLNSHATLKSEYFHYLPEQALMKLGHLKMNRLMSMEYLCTNPEWKKNSAAMSMGAIITTLGLMTAHCFEVEAALGMPIIGNSVDKSANLLGRKSLFAPIEKYGYKLDFSYIRTDQKITVLDPNLRRFAEQFWLTKKTFVNLPKNSVILESPKIESFAA